MRKRRLSKKKQDKPLELFVAGANARTTSSLAGVNKTTASYYFHRLRQLIIANSEQLEMFTWEIEVDESNFGGKRKDKRGRGAGGKVQFFDLLKRNGKVYSVVIPDVKGGTILPIIRGHVTPDSIVYADSFNSYNTLDVSEFKHLRINHSELFARGANHINGIENFWNQAKRHLRKFNGVSKEHLHLFRKECGWRFNNSDPREQIQI